jgi:hypothetical protein
LSTPFLKFFEKFLFFLKTLKNQAKKHQKSPFFGKKALKIYYIID